ncbi:hypothetical protein GCM10009630_34020 [Kribbella jejuensis]
MLMIAKSRVGWIRAGCAPGVCTSDSRMRFHSTTTFVLVVALGTDACAVRALAPSATAETAAVSAWRRDVVLVRVLARCGSIGMATNTPGGSDPFSTEVD